ncbi:MAG: type II toxin-antitoxin system MqsR family toxin [Deltaproteobacteria bacterium]|nr:type II toxin-antitoxin system MqsR family toxin [Deltaproteobacteria bacterium]
MEKRKAHYQLKEIKAAFADPDTLAHVTVSARNGARELRLSDEDIVAVIQALRTRDLSKSMTVYRDSTLWQDVYCPTYKRMKLYVKFAKERETDVYWLVSFKKNEQD